jgi:hypothetical protein
MRCFSTVMRAGMTVIFLLYSSCTAITHVDEFEAIQPEIEQCMEHKFNINQSKECAFCRCTNCEVEIRECGLRCLEIVTCAIVYRCDRGNTASCVVENCGGLLDRQQAAIEQANALAVCVGSCSDVCLTPEAISQ